jgi:hypothetical protein
VSSPNKLALPGWSDTTRRLATDEPGVGLAVLIASFLIVVIQAGAVVRGFVPVFDGGLVDTDDYMRLVRVEHLWQTGAWFDSVIPRVDPPAGLELHWTRPMDVLLMAGALLGTPLLGFKSALFWWGSAISPVLQILSVATLVWAAAPLITRRWLPLVALLYVAQPSLMLRFLAGRPDHHSLLILLFVLTLGFGLRVAQNPDKRSNAIWGGLVGAMAIWVSVESLVSMVAVIAAFALFWLFSDRRFARALVAYSAGLCAGVAMALLIDRGVSGALAVEADKISLPHLAMFAGNGVVWWMLAGAEDRGWLGLARPWRAAWAMLGAVSVSALLVWFFPQIIADPMNAGGDLYVRKHLTHVSEIQPVIAWSELTGQSAASSIGTAFLWLGIALPAVPWLVYQCVVGQVSERRMWLLLGVAALVFVPLTAYQIRWSTSAQTVLVLPYACLMAAVAQHLAVALPDNLVRIVRPFVIIGMCVWVFVPNVLANRFNGTPNSLSDGENACPINGLESTLNDPAGLGSRSMKILAFIDYGPEILYRTRHSVLSIPNHRYQAGFAASYRIMSTEDFSLARTWMREKSVDLVLICMNGSDETFYESESGGRTLASALNENAPPPFLTPIPLPAEAGSMRLFAVRPDA